MELTFAAFAEDAPGPKWADAFARRWPAYKRWFLSEGEAARPSYLAGLHAIRRHMPELVPTYERICAQAGGGDLASRFLSFFCPPAYLSGCSQAVWLGGDPIEPMMTRNYDYNPMLCDGLVTMTRWNTRRVIAMSDGAWGVVDGINDSGLALSLTFGGRRVIGEGFGIPIILRYVLEFCETASEAAAVLTRVPTHMAYNVTAVDRDANYITAYLSPDREAVVSRARVATNHQERVEWHHHARATATVERESFLLQRLTLHEEAAETFIGAFLRSPLYTSAYGRGFGTVYTAVYWPRRGLAEYRWPGALWAHGFESFKEGTVRVLYPETV